MFSPNPIIVARGYAPAKRVADVLGKAHSTIHRMVQSGRLEGLRDGRALYISVSSLIAYYENDDNEIMVEAIREAFRCG